MGALSLILSVCLPFSLFLSLFQNSLGHLHPSFGYDLIDFCWIIESADTEIFAPIAAAQNNNKTVPSARP